MQRIAKVAIRGGIRLVDKGVKKGEHCWVVILAGSGDRATERDVLGGFQDNTVMHRRKDLGGVLSANGKVIRLRIKTVKPYETEALVELLKDLTLTSSPYGKLMWLPTHLLSKSGNIACFDSIILRGFRERLEVEIKEAQRDDGELWAIVQNVEDGKHTEFRVDDGGVVWFEDRLCSTRCIEIENIILWNGLKQDEATRWDSYVGNGMRFPMDSLLVCLLLRKDMMRFGWLLIRANNYSVSSSKRDGLSERTIQLFRHWKILLSACALEWTRKMSVAHICWDEVGERLMKSFMLEMCISKSFAHSEEYYTFCWIKGDAQSRFIGPFEILERIGEVSYRLALPPQLSHVHDPDSLVQKNLNPFWIVKRLESWNKVIPFVKILWKNHPEREVPGRPRVHAS
ncbi:hypothetical protein Tco_0878945 [Tanacetum coccineum]|uniref:Tf2-1-like SH3-like domain-containing protein n=1 Tax=Tanacetum coccineum TaxID=301880 RepID=A0ABQ5C149_9ASTR